MKRVLMTGASGFLGKYVHRALLQKNFDVDTIGRSTANSIVCDLTKKIPEGLHAPYKLIVHIAGKAHVVPKTVEEAKDFYDVNALGTQNLLEAVGNTSSHPSLFVYISTVAVYGVESGEYIAENHPLNGKSPYAISKLEAEDCIAKWCQKHGIICLILRLPLVVGENAPGNLGAMENAISKGRYFNIGGGMARKSMVLAEDVAELIANAPEHTGVFNLTDGEHPSFAELSKVMAKKLDIKSPGNIPMWLARLIALAGDILGPKAPLNSEKLSKITSTLTFDDSLAKEKLGWSPKRVLAYYAG